mmetsp:Transcript_8629/g.23908  ORF Transcript_8629/g.23908 Transcript_8629/m.23908 type:complete len:302 (-) Transcript_8629:913-1818(-)
MVSLPAFALILLWNGIAFSLAPSLPQTIRSGGALAMSSNSRFEGNQRIPSSEEIQLMDEMINKLAMAKPYELPAAVKRAFKVVRSPQFFLRIATLSDAAKTDEDRQRYEALASNLVTTLEAVVETTTEQLDERAVAVETVVKAASEPDSGEFLVPLSQDRIVAMKKELESLPESSLDEGFLSTLDAWIVKSHQDGMDLMVGILQKVLQMYAGIQIQRALDRQGATAADDSFSISDLLASDAEQWDSLISSQSDESVSSVKKNIQKTMETVILALETGSMAQQVQAEYLKELLQRVEAAEKS